ncbi:MAG: carbohydrate ABC transporter permease [Candidatus Cloacimonetes bacterium]|jgi:ABC-type glycerol-3-phosphate transport system permease component|nr:carbohydrate ABC transporter permease [Candidatus Cloacimonadota bacterium]MDY0337395.1 carbohydrate ABC transporter permease [Candidatus Cloacimonadaceae bacterium]MDD2543742.1 carbohydrate ABC transporter permease [Candidatus Cloacimonadota bacterium]MDD2684344.1 carbohydrate ABC transporter permease [Candidatus Cloacimonadota bacterium]MDD3097423.1 carbohydrate ABC transporter permease [Candidatus Cloacimonadota bacterium]
MDKFRSLITYAVLLIFGLTMVVPFIWMLSTSLMTQSEFNKQETLFIPKQEYHIWNQGGETKRILLVMEKGDNSIIHVLDDKLNIVEEYKEVPSSQIELVRKKPSLQFSNYIKAFKKVPFGLYFANTLYVSFTSLIGVLITSMLAAYAFARMEFRGRDFLFYLFLSMMMVPQPIYMISSYILLDKLNWLDTYNALIVPWIANIFTIFLFRQHFKSLPKELFDAAAIDGCSTFGILWRIIMPLSKPIIATASIFSLISSWNSFMWPLVMINRPELRVLQVGLSYFNQEASTQTTLLMAASTFSILPVLVLFFLAQKQIIASTAKTGMKE